MTDIPDDVMKAAEEVAGRIRSRDDAAQAIAHAIMAERERCANVAERHARNYAVNSDWPLRDACRRVAAAIRKGQP